MRPDSSEYFAGIALNELSECHSRLPRLYSRRRLSRASGWLSLSRLDTSANAGSQPQLAGLADAGAAGVLQLAEVAAERELLFVGQMLVAEHQDGVAIHAGLDRRDVVARERAGDVDARYLADEQRVRAGRIARSPSAIRRPVACSTARPVPLIDVRRRSRTSFRSSKRRARCMTVRLSHITRSFTRHACE